MHTWTTVNRNDEPLRTQPHERMTLRYKWKGEGRTNIILPLTTADTRSSTGIIHCRVGYNIHKCITNYVIRTEILFWFVKHFEMDQ